MRGGVVKGLQTAFQNLRKVGPLKGNLRTCAGDAFDICSVEYLSKTKQNLEYTKGRKVRRGDKKRKKTRDVTRGSGTE